MNLTLAAGEQKRWVSDVYPIKQLIEIDDKTLIERIQWQFGGAVVTDCPEISAKSKYIYTPERYRWTVETLLSTAEFWRDQQIITLGDVYYTKEAVKTIKDFKGAIQFFGTIHEIFAISFTDFEGVTKHLTDHVKKLENMVTYPSHGKLWQLYRRYNGYNRHIPKIDKNFTFIEDETQDFDEIDDLNSFHEK